MSHFRNCCKLHVHTNDKSNWQANADSHAAPQPLNIWTFKTLVKYAGWLHSARLTSRGYPLFHGYKARKIGRQNERGDSHHFNHTTLDHVAPVISEIYAIKVFVWYFFALFGNSVQFRVNNYKELVQTIYIGYMCETMYIRYVYAKIKFLWGSDSFSQIILFSWIKNWISVRISKQTVLTTSANRWNQAF